ncbi:MAG: hypothetical protein AB8E15_08280 [Bdellovibrionales bacterium]
MGIYKRRKKEKSYLLDSEAVETGRFYLNIFFLFTLVTLASCISGKKQTQNNKPVEAKQEKYQSSFLEKFEILPIVGDNIITDFHPQREELLYQSKNRLRHKQYQVYRYLFADGIEKRVTHQIGDSIFPSYHPLSEHLIYSSNTDSKKEKIEYHLFKGKKKKALSDVKIETLLTNFDYGDFFDLYISRLTGAKIIRATSLPGDELYAIYNPKSLDITFNRKIGSDSRLEKMSRFRKGRKNFSREGLFVYGTDHSPDGKTTVSILKNKKESNSQLIFFNPNSKVKKISESPFYDISQVYFKNQDWVIFHAQKNPEIPFSIYAMNTKSFCEKMILKTDTNLLSSRSSLSKLYFTSHNTDEGHQIMSAIWKSPLKCDNEPAI